MKNKFTKLAIIMGDVLVLMSAIPVVGTACLFCDDPIHEETTTETTTEETTTEVVTIPDTDAL